MWTICWVFRPANAFLRMHLRGQKQWKAFKNHENSIFFIMHKRGSCKANEQKWRKSLLVSGREWLPKAGCHPKAGCSFRILLFSWFSNVFSLFLTVQIHAQACVCWLALRCKKCYKIGPWSVDNPKRQFLSAIQFF